MSTCDSSQWIPRASQIQTLRIAGCISQRCAPSLCPAAARVPEDLRKTQNANKRAIESGRPPARCPSPDCHGRPPTNGSRGDSAGHRYSNPVVHPSAPQVLRLPRVQTSSAPCCPGAAGRQRLSVRYAHAPATALGESFVKNAPATERMPERARNANAEHNMARCTHARTHASTQSRERMRYARHAPHARTHSHPHTRARAHAHTLSLTHAHTHPHRHPAQANFQCRARCIGVRCAEVRQ